MSKKITKSSDKHAGAAKSKGANKPKLYPLIIRIGDEQLETKSAKNIGDLLLEVNIKNHPVWSQGKATVVQESSRGQKFASKFKPRVEKN